MPSKKQRRTGRNINLWIAVDLARALDTYLDAADPAVTQTSAIESAIREFLRSRNRAGQISEQGKIQENVSTRVDNCSQ